MKVAYFGFDLFYDCLEQIVKSGHEIVKIFTCKVDGEYEFSNKVYSFESKNNIKITDEKVSVDDIISLKNAGCELLFSAGYYFKIPVVADVLGVNVHPALLPIGRGPWPQPVTILKDIKKTGITLHKLSAGFDEGDIILQKSFNLDSCENLETLTEKYAYYARIATEELFCEFEKLILNSVEQQKGEYWPEPTKNDMTFFDTDDENKIDTVLRAFYGFKCEMITKERTVKIKKGQLFFEVDNHFDENDIYKVNGGYVVVFEYA